jgi:hypothetical protein
MTKSERFGIFERMLLARRSFSFAELQQGLEVSRAMLHRDLKERREDMKAEPLALLDNSCRFAHPQTC